MKMQIKASVLEKVGPRSYTVATPKGTLQRNRSQIRAMPQKGDQLQGDNANVLSEDKNTEVCSSEANSNEDTSYYVIQTLLKWLQSLMRK